MKAIKAKKYLEMQRVRFAKTMAPEMLSAVIASVEALDKQIPKKAVAKGVIYHCPNCNDVLNDIMKYSFCDRCGQAIDWSEDV